MSSNNAIALRLELTESHDRLAICRRDVERPQAALNDANARARNLDALVSKREATIQAQAERIVELQTTIPQLVPTQPRG
jgi:hypothetical protein